MFSDTALAAHTKGPHEFGLLLLDLLDKGPA
jgi:hypothetical protein